MPETRFFLGTNGPKGFCSLYDELTEAEGLRLYILKGGPGCGKSSFMRRIADEAKSRGYDTELIRCSGDPDSMDALVIPALSSAFLDGTAPHVSEPKYPGVSGMYIDLGRFYDAAALHEYATEVAAGFLAYKARYRRAYSLINGAFYVTEHANDAFLTEEVIAAVRKRADGIARREFGKRGTEKCGKATKRFLAAFTCHGFVCCTETLVTLCDRLYLLDDRYSLADIVLKTLADSAEHTGYDTVRCPDPRDPKKLQALLVPALSLGFLAAGDGKFPKCVRPYRHIRLDSMADAYVRTPQAKKSVRAAERQAETLLKFAQNELSEAKRLHDELEAIYNPHVDFDGVYAEAERYAKLLFGET